MISVLTVNYFAADDLARLIDSLRRHAAGHDIELIITNNSRDERLAFDRDPELPVTVIPSPNIGFACGINLACRRARGDLLFIANPD
ncbi:MAG: glycosyltransferase family 2 protein, partial [Phycisphaerae bacterium]